MRIIKRRHFIKNTSIVGAGITITPHLNSLAYKNKVAPQGKIGIIGLDTLHKNRHV